MAKKESPKMQEMGPKKYKAMQEKSFKFYDEHKVGKRDPKTGEVFRSINFSNPNKPKQKSLTSFECFGCGEGLSITRSTIRTSCGRCQTSHKVEVDKLTDEVTINGVKLDEYGQRPESGSK